MFAGRLIQIFSEIVSPCSFVRHQAGRTEGKNRGKSAGRGIGRAAPGDTLTDGIDLGSGFSGGAFVPERVLAQDLEIAGLFGVKPVGHFMPRDP